ncbi:cleavage and polyadenylation specificity factorsubunit 1 [Lichtheimia corymbifera JMRC:FSU:9682]|uniref:Cleavage and polyadenylation specificity factorsubunit 1 n=1 Tax=Lichtheimia corymbifera JMRC:FSU:9682 TaxID=1263082 RepID=A0A068SD23_9FUNG|nr:cleavage and polyadenylation specificity factorsubunit 1 [Lichtheimia corymbifera JMRC:FSU:9682]
MSAYAIYKELFPPQTVEHVQRGQFTSPDTINLIVAKASLLQIYNFIEYVPQSNTTTDTNNADNTQDNVEENDLDTQNRLGTREDEEQGLVYPQLRPAKNGLLDTSSARLELVAQYKLNGNVSSMGVVRTSSPRGKQGCDSLLLAFNDAKMSLLEWSPTTNSIVTVSIHYYERDEYKKEFLSNPYPTDIHIDPQQRCAVLNFYGDKLAVLPFRQSDKLDESNKDYNQEKWPYSSSFVIDLESIDKRIKNVIDMTFLGDYYEPTLAILFETEPTWTGRLANVKDTVSVVVISLDLTARIYPVIYSIDNLPYDCRRLVPMPKPVNGLLVLASNSILHVAQGSPGVGVAVNGFVEPSTDFRGMIYDEKTVALGLALDGVKALALSGARCLLFLQNGDWVIVKVKLDGNKVVGMDLDKIAWSDPDIQKEHQHTAPLAMVPSCVASIRDNEYLFLGSRVGDSLLVKWNLDTGSRKDDYDFRVCDRLLNTGPIVDMAIGQDEPLQDEEATPLNTLPDLELVSCSGYGQNGSLCVFQRHIRPETTFTFNQEGCEAVWSIKCRKEQYFEGVQVGGNMNQSGTGAAWDLSGQIVPENTWNGEQTWGDLLDKFLFISKPKGTLVLATGEEFQQVENADFYTAGPTVNVGTLFDHTRIVQIHANAALLLSPGGKLIQTVHVKQARIVDASISDPYVLLKLENGAIMLFQGDSSSKQLSPITLPPHLTKKRVSMASLFVDTSGLFTSVSERQLQRQSKQKVENEKKRKAHDNPMESSNVKKMYPGPSNTTDMDFDEVDLDLYGDQDETEAAEKPASVAVNNSDNTLELDDDDAMLYRDETKEQPNSHIDQSAGGIDEVNVSIQGGMGDVTPISYWCIVYTTDGCLKLFSLDDLQECFSTPNFDALSKLVIDQKSSDATDAAAPSKSSLLSLEDNVSTNIKEILLTNIGKERKDPHLVVRTESNDIVIYKAFQYLPEPGEILHEGDQELTDCHSESIQGDRLALRFSRVHHEHVSRTTSRGTTATEQDQEPETTNERRRLIPFNDVAGFTGVFMAGPQPVWLMCSCKSFVRVHPMSAKGEIIGFTQFHNVNCRHGFITVDTNYNLRLSVLQVDNVTYDMDWVVQKVPLHQTVHKIAYHPVMRVYSVLVSEPKPVRLRNDDGTWTDGQEDERKEGDFLPTVDKFSLLMVSPVTWETVDRVEFNEYEQGLSLECAVLESKQTKSGKKHFIAVGTGYLRGEDTAMRGSIQIFDIIEVVPEPNNPQTNHRYKHLHTEEVKGAVTALCDVIGHLVSCIGSKIIIWSFEDNESLVGVAFIDVQIYVTSISAIKNFIVLGDAQKSVWFLGFQLEPAKLVLLAKDYQSFEVSSVNFLIDDKSMYLLIGDTDDNLDIFQYAPFNLQSFAGQKLIRRGDFHVGGQVRSMVRLPQVIQEGESYRYSRRHFCLCGSFSGSISAVSPIPEKTFKRLNTLYGQLVNGLQHVAGLNPRAFRLIKGHKQRMSSNRTKAVLDGDLIFEFAGLSVGQQREMTKQIGTTVTRIMEDLVEIDIGIDHF